MTKQKRFHFSHDARIRIFHCEGISIRDSLLITQALDGMSFDDLEKLSKAITTISAGYFRDSFLKLLIKKVFK